MSSKSVPGAPRRRNTNKGLRVERRYTTAGKDRFETFTFVERDAVVRDFSTGEIKFALTVEVPDDWDQGAVDVLASKYCRKAGVPQYDADGAPVLDDGEPVLGPERSAKQVIGRMAAAWRIWGEKGGYFASAADAQAFEDEMAYMVMNQMGAPNSPQWFNTGIFEAYGIIEDAEGNAYWDPELNKIVDSAHKYERSAASACYISAVEDNLVGPDGILAFAMNEARLFKGGSGSGANLSYIREKGAKLTAGGVSSGVMGFARGHDRFAGAIKCLDVDTPVITNMGSMRIGDVRAGLKVLTRHGFRSVTDAHDNGRRPVVKLTSEFGTEIVCTREHRFWVRTRDGVEGWREAGTIGPEDRIAFDLSAQHHGVEAELRMPGPGHHNEKTLSLPATMSEDFGLWLGLMWGDGSVSRTSSSSSIALQVGDDTPDLPGIYERLARRVFGDSVHFVYSRHTDRPDASVSIRISSTHVFRFLELNGLRKPQCHELRIPDAVKSAPPAVRASFLAGLFEADGTVENGYASLSTVSPGLAADTHTELLSLGIPSAIAVQPIRTGAYGQAPMHRVRIVGGEGMRRFAKIVGFVSDRKQASLEAALARKSASPFETQWVLPGARAELMGLWERYPHMRRAVAPYSTYTACRSMSLLRARTLVERFPDEFSGTAVERFAAGNELWARVTIADAGERHVADLTVEDVHEYLVGSAVTHNSGGTTRRAAKMVILDAEHPDIEEFVNCKVVEERIARDLIAAGYDSGYDTPGGAYDIVSFQNANHSVRIPRGFMGLVNDDGDLELTSRRDGAVVKTISARKLWDDIAEAAWFCADPGVQFDGIINDWATAPNDGRIRGSNPCFTGDTLVATSVGPIRFDDMAHRAANGETFSVYTHDATNVDNPTDELVLSTADAVMVTGINDIVRLDLSNGTALRCTPTHRIWTSNRGWVEAEQLTGDDLLLASSGPSDTDFAAVTLLSRTAEGREVTYNLSEPRNHSYVANGVVVRNCSEYLHVDDTACFAPETRVSTPGGLRTVEDLYRDQSEGCPVLVTTDIVSEDDHRQLTAHRPALVTKVGEREVLRIEFKDGRRLRVTPDHLLLTEEGWKAAGDLEVGRDRVRVREGGNPVRFDSASEAVDRWRMLGWLSGDGVFSKGTAALVFGPHESATAARMSEEFVKLVREGAGPGARVPSLYTQVNGVMQIGSKATATVDHLEQTYGCHQGTAIYKDVPDAVHVQPDDLKVAYLQGLFSADGSFMRASGTAPGHVMLASSSPSMLRSVQLLLSDLGITSRIFWSHPVGRKNPQGQLRIYNQQARSYMSLIGFPCSETKQALVDEELAQAFRSPAKNPRPVTVVSITADGIETVYDITEPSTRSVIVEGLVAHNCNLASINLGKFFDSARQSFDIDGYIHAARLWTITLEITVAMSHYPTPSVAANSYEHRTLGLGYANLGALVMRAGLAYDSREARAAMGAVTSLMNSTAYATSAEMAAAVGTCAAYDRNVDAMARVISNHRRAAYGTEAAPAGIGGYDQLEVTPQDVDHRMLARTPFGPLTEHVVGQADRMVDMVAAHGVRNMQATVIAPTGCLVPGSLVVTDHGLVRLGGLGDPDGAQWQNLDAVVNTDEGPRNATKFFINGLASTVAVRTERGHSIIGTPEHRVKVVADDGTWSWKRFGDIVAGDLVPVALNSMIGEPHPVRLAAGPEANWHRDVPVEFPTHMTPALAELVGYFMGDGSLHGRGLRFQVADTDPDVIDRLGVLAKETFNLAVRVTNDPRGKVASVELHSVRLGQWWVDAGLAKEPISGKAGKGGYLPRIPDAVLWSNDREIYSSFLRGLFEADGTVSRTNGSVSLTTAKAEFADELQTLMSTLGYVTGRSNQMGGYSSAPTYRVVLYRGEYVDRWLDEVGFMSNRKAQLLASFGPSSTKKDWVPVPLALVDELLPAAERGEAVPLRTKLRQRIKGELRKRGAVSRPLVRTLFELTDDERVEHLLGFFYDRVAAVDEAGDRLTYDISVPDNVTYLANGFVSHNTIGLVMSCDTTGPEPDFALVKWKKLAGGGSMKIVNGSVPAALAALGYDPAASERIVSWALGSQTLDVHDVAVNRTTLSEAGLADHTLDSIEAALPTAAELTMAFAPHVVGDDVYAAHGLDPAVDAASTLLTALGFSTEQIVSASKRICGHGTVEGAPDMAPEDLAVFDTANLCGDGTRHIAWQGHVTALGAIQPHISGASSKTINMPNSATVDDIRSAHELAYELGVKCVAVYRDGCKASQPLSSAITADSDSNEDDPASRLPLHTEIAPGMSPSDYYHGQVPPRFRLPKNRSARTFSFEIGGMDCYVTTGEYDDGSLGEMWLNVGKDGSTMRGAFSAFSIAVSLGLQRGVPLEHYVDKYTGHNFAPNGIVIHPNLKMASSIPDAIFRLLGWWYLGRDDLVQVPGERRTTPAATVETPAVDAPADPAPPSHGASMAGSNPYTGNLCPECSSPEMVKNGTCERCLTCGTTTGCS